MLEVDVFTDLDCDACDEAERVLSDALRKFPIHTRGVIHLPSAEHRWSMQAAKAFDCAYEDGQGSEMYQALRKRRSEFARMSWDSLAKEVDVYDLEAFRRCMAGRTTPRIEAGLSLAKRLGLPAAPAVIVDGWLVYPVTLEALTSALEEARLKRNAAAYRW
ncbi:MAG TPA: thioredoxin domain-containing protein [Gemmatimonadaceae bacterium]